MADINENRPGYKQTKVGWVPEEWEVLSLKHLRGGKRPVVKAGPFGSSLKKEFYTDTGYKIYGQEQVIRNDPFYGDYYIGEEKFKSLQSCEVLPGDVLISLVGTIGKVLIIPEDAEKGIINPRLLRISVAKNHLLPLYLSYFFKLEKTINLLERWSQGGTMGVLNAGILSSIPIILPPFPEQRRIAAILSTWDAAIGKLDRLLAKKRTLKKGLMQQLLTGQRRFPEFVPEGGTRYKETKVGRVPVEWEVSTLGDLGSTYTGLTGKSKKDFGNGAKYIPYMNVFSNSAIDESQLEFVNVKEGENQNRVQFGDVFFTVSSETPNEVGMSSVLLSEIGNCYLNSFCFGFRPHDFEKTKPEYFRYALRSQMLRKAISTLAQGATRYNLSKRYLLKVEIPLPPLSEQSRIAAVLSTCDEEIAALEREKERFDEQKKGLMQQLLTGAVRVKA